MLARQGTRKIEGRPETEEAFDGCAGGDYKMANDLMSDSKMTLTKADLVERVFEQAGLSKREATDVIELIFQHMKDRLQRGDKVKISGFGNFIVRHKKPRVGRNPQTGDEMMITARSVLTFKPSQVLKAMLNRDLPDRHNSNEKAWVVS